MVNSVAQNFDTYSPCSNPLSTPLGKISAFFLSEIGNQFLCFKKKKKERKKLGISQGSPKHLIKSGTLDVKDI